MNTATVTQMANWESDPLERNRRQTGRTTRMFEAAIASAAAGQATVVLLKDRYSVDHWTAKFGLIPGLEIIGMKVKMPELDWQQLKLTDHRANSKLFIDHDVFYGYYKHILRAWAEYELPMVLATIPTAAPFEHTPHPGLPTGGTMAD